MSARLGTPAGAPDAAPLPEGSETVTCSFSKPWDEECQRQLFATPQETVAPLPAPSMLFSTPQWARQASAQGSTASSFARRSISSATPPLPTPASWQQDASSRARPALSASAGPPTASSSRAQARTTSTAVPVATARSLRPSEAADAPVKLLSKLKSAAAASILAAHMAQAAPGEPECLVAYRTSPLRSRAPAPGAARTASLSPSRSAGRWAATPTLLARSTGPRASWQPSSQPSGHASAGDPGSEELRPWRTRASPAAEDLASPSPSVPRRPLARRHPPAVAPTPDSASSSRAAAFAHEASLHRAASSPGDPPLPPTLTLATVAPSGGGGGGGGELLPYQGGGDKYEQQLLELRERAEWRIVSEQRGEGAQAMGRWRLPRVTLSAVDDQYLFELNVKLQYAEDDRALHSSLQELLVCAAADFPAEAFLQRAAVLDNCLALLGSPASAVLAKRLVIAFLHALLLKLKRALVACEDPALLPVYAEFAGPNANGDCMPEEDALLSSYPQPGDAAALPDWRQPSLCAEPALDITACCHVVAIHVIPALRMPECQAGAAALLDELMPLVATDADSRGSEAANARASEYLAGLGRVLEVGIKAADRRQGGAEGVDDPLTGPPLDQMPVLDAAAVHVLDLVARFLGDIEPGQAPEAVPAALAARLRCIWCNPCMDALLPGWRARMEPYVAAFAPDAMDAACLAKDAAHALQQAELLTQQAAAVRSGAVDFDEWAAGVPAALAALAFPPHHHLLRSILSVLSHAAAPPAPGQDSHPERRASAATLLLRLLHHQSPAVRRQTWAWLAKLLHDATTPPSSKHGLLSLLAHPAVLRPIVVHTLAPDAEHRDGAVRALESLLDSPDGRHRSAALAWRPWLDCYESDEALGRVHALAEAAAVTADGLEWAALSVTLQRLYCKQTAVRRRAAKRLLSAVACCSEGLLEDSQIAEDPFRGLLDGGAHCPIDPAGDDAHASRLRIADVHGLMAAVTDADLPRPHRCSAAHQLCAAVKQPALLAAVALPSFLEGVLREVEAAVCPGSAPAADDAAERAPLSIYDMQLPVACLFLLGLVTCESRGVLAWMLSHTGGRLQRLMPLAFHPLTMVRRAFAYLLAPVLFPPACELGGPLPPPAAHAAGSLVVFAPFAASHHFPMPTEPAALSPPSAVGGDRGDALAARLLDDDRREVPQMVAVLLPLGCVMRLAGVRAAADAQAAEAPVDELACCREHLSALLDHLPGDVELPYEINRSLAASLRLNNVSDRAAHAWAALATAATPKAPADALDSLLALCMSPAATALVFAAPGCSGHFHRLLTAPPSRPDDHAMWHHMLALLQHALASSALSAAECDDVLTHALAAAVGVIAGLSSRGVVDGGDGDDSVPAAIATRRSLALQLPTAVAVLQVLTSLLRAVRATASPERLERALRLVAGVDLVGLLINSMLASADADPRCRCAAAACLAQVTAICATTTHPDAAGALAAPSPADRADGQLPPALPGALAALLQCLVRNVGMPHQQQIYLCRHRHLLRLALRMLRDITRALPCGVWACAWEDAVGVFWLTRILRDRDAEMRAAAARLLAALAHPRARPMRDALLRAWPEGGAAMVRTATSRVQCPGVRAAALHFVAAAMASSTADLPQSHADAEGSVGYATGIVDFGREALLARNYLWEGALAAWPHADESPPHSAALAALCLQLTAALPAADALARLSAPPGCLQALTSLLELGHRVRTFQASAVGRAAGLLRRRSDPDNKHTHALLDASLGDAAKHIADGARCAAWTVHALVTRCDWAALEPDAPRLSQLLLSALCSLLPATAALRAPVTPAHSAAHAAACAAAVAASHALAALLRQISLSGDQPLAPLLTLQLPEAASCSLGRCQLATALALALGPRSAAPRSVRRAAGLLLAAVLSSAERARVVLLDPVTDAEWTCPADDGGGSSRATNRWSCGSVPPPGARVGEQLIRGALNLLQGDSADAGPPPPPPLGLRTAQPEATPSAAPRAPRPGVGAPLDAGAFAAVRAVLAYSATAKALVLDRGLHLPWIRDVEALAAQVVSSSNKEENSLWVVQAPSGLRGRPGAPEAPPAPDKGDRDAARAALATRLSLLRHLAIGCDRAKSALAQSGVCESLHSAWRGVVVADDLCCEALLLLAALLAQGCPEARHACTVTGHPSLATHLMRLAFRSGLSRRALDAACQALANLAGSLDGTQALLRAAFLPDACKALRAGLAARDDARAAPLLAVLAAMASHAEGQRALLRAPAAPPLMDLLLLVAREGESRSARVAAVLVLRNLALRLDNKPHFLADPRALPVLVAQLENVSAEPEAAAYGASALWALLHRGERVKATLKGVPGAVASVQRCLAIASALLEHEGPGARTRWLRQTKEGVLVVLRLLGSPA